MILQTFFLVAVMSWGNYSPEHSALGELLPEKNKMLSFATQKGIFGVYVEVIVYRITTYRTIKLSGHKIFREG
jgi:hypothetical protein